jgi:hypothetical protein
VGIVFNLFETSSSLQMVAYCHELKKLGLILENILQYNFTSLFQNKYNFGKSRFILPSLDISFLEKTRILAPELESILKQYKLFVEDGNIDFELLQITSSPSSVKEIPSLVSNKYIYLNENNDEVVTCSHLFFSDQTTLAYVKPFETKRYHCLFDLFANEEQIQFKNYAEYQKQNINYLIAKGLILLDEDGLLRINDPIRVFIYKDLYENEVASFHHYPLAFQQEVKKMELLNMVSCESSLFSKPEQSYFNYFLNKSEFTNGLDLRNSYVHGTQANPEETKKHEYAYYSYLKLLVLALLKIEDDLQIFLFTQTDVEKSKNAVTPH